MVSALFEDDVEELCIINSTGTTPKWELLSVTVDSGAAESVVPEEKCSQYPTKDTEKSMSG
eukprot:3842026-Karenia_brevis.AAC.1